MGMDDPTLSSRASAFFIAAEGISVSTAAERQPMHHDLSGFLRRNTRAFGSLPYRLGLAKPHLGSAGSADCLQQPLRTCHDEF
jgi:hypothetical protein